VSVASTLKGLFARPYETVSARGGPAASPDPETGPGVTGTARVTQVKPARTRMEIRMCSPAVCDRCKKVTWTGCGAHVAQVLANVPQDKRCTCR
jgi:hypothetical protein